MGNCAGIFCPVKVDSVTKCFVKINSTQTIGEFGCKMQKIVKKAAKILAATLESTVYLMMKR